MSDRIAPLVERVRRPEYTGENRCVPCTALNVALAIVASALVAIASGGLAVGVFLVALLAIYLRGYLVPATPWLTARYFPDRVLARFDAHPTQRHADWETVERIEHRRENAVDPERFLLEAGAVEPCDREDDLCLTDGFDRRLNERTAARDGSIDPEAAKSLFDGDPDSMTVLDRPHPVLEVGRRVRKWPSEAALLADVAAHEALSGLTGQWAGIPAEQRLGILESLRSFRATCPRCSAPIAISEDTRESCCRSYEVVTLACRECEQPLLEFDPEALGPDEESGIV
ncbi:hypothetical protein [Halalkalicoccus subterraneus]|uniref:hypothetical protein n=1 Tax=Halalkalicoccus subterraneus TaxID=2675002 RepID=UPI000EFB0585|nr:hypothetical protein [Halalkalicoccus subterraneus]